MKAGDCIRITGPATSAFCGEEGLVIRVRSDGALLWRPHLYNREAIWIDPRNVVVVDDPEGARSR